ncbi:MAG: DUF1887 family protein [Gammaproteobacteria bacterium]|nr:DUF1887 family protein [Gammaproteobacteria bacterium]NNM13323.1 DUF1887 family protein [Gammaproteobacteria bacterium]
MSQTKKKRIHVCLITDQPNTIITPLLDKRTRPHQVIIVASPDIQEKVEWLSTTLKKHKIPVIDWQIQDAWDVHTIQKSMQELLNTYKNAALTLNAAGGTKAMNIAACHVFRAANLPIFYVHPKTDTLMWVNDGKRKDFNLADKISIDDYMGVRGAEVVKTGTVAIDRSPLEGEEKKLVFALAQAAPQISNAFNVLNRLATRADREDRTRLKPNDLKSKGLKQLLGIYQQHKFLHYTKNELVFKSYQARWYASGGWLEAYVFDVISKLQQHIPQIQDVARNVKVHRQTPTGIIPNEIDVAFLYNNSLHIIECKTQRFRRKKSSTGHGLKAIYKLDSLRDLLGGIRGKAMLVALENLSEGNQRRADDLNIFVAANADLKNLGTQIEVWLKSAT